MFSSYCFYFNIQVSAYWKVGLICAGLYLILSACGRALIQRSNNWSREKAGGRNNLCFYGGWIVDVFAAILLVFAWGCAPLSSIAALLPLQIFFSILASSVFLRRRIHRYEVIGSCVLIGFAVCTIAFGSRAVIKDPTYYHVSDVLTFWKDPWTLAVGSAMICIFFGLMSVLVLDTEGAQSGLRRLCEPIISGLLCSWCFFWFKFTAMQPLSMRWFDSGMMYFSDFGIGFALTIVFGLGSWYVSHTYRCKDDYFSRMMFLASTVFFLLVEAAVFFDDWNGVAVWKIILFHVSAICCLVTGCCLYSQTHPHRGDGDQREITSDALEQDMLRHQMISVICAGIGFFLFYVLFFTFCIGVMTWQTNYLANYDKKSQTGLPTLGVLAVGHNMGQIIEEFVRHYREEGVSQFVVVDWHRSNDKWIETARRLNVTVVQEYDEDAFQKKFGAPYNQIGLYNAYLDMVKTDWFLLIDGDEFAYARGEHPTIPHYLATLSDHVSAVSIPWKIFGGSNNYHQPRSIIHGFKQRSSNGKFGRAFKEILRTHHVKKAMHHHSVVEHYRIYPNGKATFPFITGQGGFGNYRNRHESEMSKQGIQQKSALVRS